MELGKACFGKVTTMIDLLNDPNPADAMATVAQCLLSQAGVSAEEPQRGHQISRFLVDVNRIVIEADDITWEIKATSVAVLSDDENFDPKAIR